MEFRENKAIYIQIAEYVFEQILLKKWPIGEKIISVRELAVHLEVNPNTVMRTYETLQNMAIIQNKRGIGFFVTEEAISLIKTHQKKEFLEKELPALFKNMYLLQMNTEELKSLYDNYIQLNYPQK